MKTVGIILLLLSVGLGIAAFVMYNKRDSVEPFIEDLIKIMEQNRKTLEFWGGSRREFEKADLELEEQKRKLAVFAAKRKEKTTWCAVAAGLKWSPERSQG
jgi:hypothetical protein